MPEWAEADKSTKKAMQKHSQRWFKSHEGGRELACKVFDFDLSGQLGPLLLPFLNAIRGALSMSALEAFPQPPQQAEAFVVEHDGEE